MEIKNQIERVLSSNIKDLVVLSDSHLEAGSNWAKELTVMRNEAKIFLLLVSNAYLNSKTVDEELSHIMHRAEKESAYVIPVILENCAWQNKPFATYQALPKFGKPIRDFSIKEEAFFQITEALGALALLLKNSKATGIIKREKKVKSGTLELSECRLTSIPRDLLDMPWLTRLNLDRNHIKQMENLEKLTKLQSLNLVNNEIEQIGNLDNLESLNFLDLENNKLIKIENLDQNKNLTILGVSSNYLNSLSGISHLQQLKTLYAGHNHLINVQELSKMPQLKRIILTNNQIQSIKPLFNLIASGLEVALRYSYDSNEEGIFIKDNKTLSEPSIEVIEKGRDAIIKYFKDAATYGTKRLEVLKLILVGNSKVGKSNFSEFLRGLPITQNHNSTHLLDIQRWDTASIKSERGEAMRVNIFDFGGQDYYHDSHRMYYSHDTAYILLWDTDSNKYSEETEVSDEPESNLIYENFPLEYWLESINYNLADRFRLTYNPERRADPKTNYTGNTAPVFILQNKIDIAEGMLDQKMLSKKYQNISVFFGVSLKAKRRTNILLEVLNDYMHALNLSGRKLIKYEHSIVEDYVNNPRDFKVISLDEFYNDCKSIINDDNIPFNKDNALIIAEILNAIGIIFYDKQSETDGIVFTQINRLNEIIKEVMDIAKKGSDKGIFSTNQIQHILHKEDIIKLLIKNKSIIPINETDFLVPQFLPIKPDSSIAFFLHAFTFNQVRFLYKAYFHKTLLLSLFSQYLGDTISGNTTSVKNLPFWRNGIIISRGEGSNKQMVFVEFIKTDAEGIINIKTMAPYNKTGLERDIEKTLDDLNKGWSVSKEISVNSVDFFDVNELKKEVKDLRYEFSANGKVFSVNDFKHITDFDKLPKKLFISYSSKNSEFIKRFVTHLEVLKSAGLIDPWYDRMIESGTKWDDTIRAEMSNSDIIIFLLSPDFLATEYIMKTEIPLAIEQMKDAIAAKFFFVELQPCGWKRTEIAKYQQTDDSGEIKKNIISIGQPDNDAKWNLVIDELETKMNR